MQLWYDVHSTLYLTKGYLNPQLQSIFNFEIVF